MVTKEATEVLELLIRRKSVIATGIINSEVTRALEWLTAQRERSDAQKITALMVLSACIRGASLVMLEHLPKILEALKLPLCSSKVELSLKLREHREISIRKEVMVLLPLIADYSPTDMSAKTAAGESYMERAMGFLIPQSKKKSDQEDAFIAIGKMALATKELYTSFLVPTMATLRSYLIESIKYKGSYSVSGAFECIGSISKALGPVILKHIQDIVGIVLMTGLSTPLCSVLEILIQEIPQLALDIQERLIDMISVTLVGKPFYRSYSNSIDFSMNNSAAFSKTDLLEIDNLSYVKNLQNSKFRNDITYQGDPSKNTDEILIALKTLGTFGFEEQNLSELLRNDIMMYLSSNDVTIRRETINAVSKIISTNHMYWQHTGPSIDVTNDIIQHLISVSITDDDSSIRVLAIQLFSETDQFDFYLGKIENIESLLMMLNDEVFDISEMMVLIICRLSLTNPAYVIPSLRRLVIQLLTQIEHSNNSQEKEGCIKLLMIIVELSEKWIGPYIPRIVEIVIPKILDANPRLSTKYLDILGALSTVARHDLLPYTESVIEVLIECLQDQTSPIKRMASLKTLGKYARYVGIVSKPLKDHPEMIEILLNMLKSDEDLDIRQEAIKVIGNMGSIDPYIYSQYLKDSKLDNPQLFSPDSSAMGFSSGLDIAGSRKIDESGVYDIKVTKTQKKNIQMGGSMNIKKVGYMGDDNQLLTFQNLDEDLPIDSLGTTFTTDEYHTQMSLYMLVKILRDPMLSEYHTDACQAIIIVYTSLGSLCTKYLRDVVPAIIFAMNMGGIALREFYFEQLGRLVISQKQLIRPYLGVVFELFKNDLGTSPKQQSAAIALIEVVAEVLVGDFGSHLSTVLPFLLNIIEKDQSETRNPTLRVLHAIQIICNNIDAYLTLTIPRLIGLLDFRKQTVVVVDAALKTIAPIVLSVNCRTFASKLILPLIRLYREAPTSFLQNQIMDLFCVLMQQLQDDFVIFMPSIHNAIQCCGTEKQHVEYERCSRDLFSNRLEHAEMKMLHPTLRSEAVVNDDPLTREPKRQLKPNFRVLKRAWATSQKVNKDDWADWMKHLSVELLKESSSPALRACALLASRYSPLGEKLFNSAFVSCFSELSEDDQKELIQSIGIAAENPQVPPEILQAILNLAEYMERDEKPIPISLEKLGDYAQSCHALAKALHYKEIEWELAGGENVVQDLIKLNQDLDNSDAAVGALAFLRKSRPDLADQAEWHARLGQWDEALTAYKIIESRFDNLETSSSVENLEILCQDLDIGENTQKKNCSHTIVKTLSVLNTDTSDIQSQKLDIYLGEMNCYYHLADWELLLPIIREMWNYKEEIRSKVAWIGVNISWAINDISQMETYLNYLPESNKLKSFYHALVSIDKKDFEEASHYIATTRERVLEEMSAQLTESFIRGFSMSVLCQMLSELEEVIKFKTLEDNKTHQDWIINTWQERLNGCQHEVSTWQRLLQIRSLVLPKTRILETWLEFAQMCMNSDQMKLCEQVLKMIVIDEIVQRRSVASDTSSINSYSEPVSSVKTDTIIWDENLKTPETNLFKINQQNNRSDVFTTESINQSNSTSVLDMFIHSSRKLGIEDSFDSLEPFIEYSIYPELMYIYYKFKWKSGEKDFAINSIESISNRLKSSIGFNLNTFGFDNKSVNHKNNYYYDGDYSNHTKYSRHKKLLSKFYYTQAQWLMESNKNEYNEVDKEASAHLMKYGSMHKILKLYQASTVLDKHSYISWHTWALRHYQVMQQIQLENHEITSEMVEEHIVPSVYGFFKAIQLSNTDTTLQDTLRLLTVWFNYGHIDSVSQAISTRFNDVKITTWIQVIPQILARIHTPHDNVRRLIIRLLVDIGKAHPQAILFSLTVTSKSSLGQKQVAANSILEKLRDFYPTLVEQTEMVSTELVRIAILWTEMWHESLEAASRMYFSVGDYKGMIAKLMPLHALLHKKPETLRELHFIQTYGRELREAEEWCIRFSETMSTNPNPNYLRHAWDVYYSIFRKIEKALKQMNSLNLKNVSPKLLDCKSLELAIPGSYTPNKPVIYIDRFNAQISIYSSKQRPRRLQVAGSDGKLYTFLLKGHEDLKQDERVMQLFDLINNLLNRDPETSRRHLSIERFPVIPLSPESGLIGFYPDCDTLHSLIKSYRESRNIVINIEHKYMSFMAPDYEFCTILERLEAFEYGMERTEGNDLQKVLWYKSINAEVWLDRRTNYTRSLAVMSMAGYILGLGDRHPSNLLIHNATGKVVHIDFGDCFEAAINREKFPETVPFRLTRMLVKAMEVNGIEGSFKITSQHTLRVMRANRDSLMAVLEAFVYDPLVSWHYLQDRAKEFDTSIKHMSSNMNLSQSLVPDNYNYPHKINESGIQDQWQIANPKAIAIINRINNKLSGRDFNPRIKLDIPKQVDCLISQATAVENLCQCYFGWCAFW
ncbi:hypothetical protein BB561_004248 [Smittium simulii]|uniref:Serine/threonine-protein kinase TOR n=1 Tax=Smittium simulii TaxID=133385 RepID=A0A2T9YHD3_9FUNG|nr:hypothetical protein BB561_004248 [Smittium simulii]